MLLDYVFTFLISLAPFTELRGGLPYAFVAGIPWYWAFLVAVAGNILAIPLYYVFLNSLNRLLLRIKLYKKWFTWLVRRVQKRIAKNYTRQTTWALTFLVAIPLPMTGAYTGTLASWLLGIPLKRAFPYLAIGVVIAGVAVLALLLTGTALFGISIP